jgi:voltage-gated potassium channel
MVLFEQTGVAVFLVLLTLCLQCAGITAIIDWLRKVSPREITKLRMTSSAALVMRVTVAIIVLQGFAILLWAACYRWLCLPSWLSAFYYSASSYSTEGSGMQSSRESGAF